MTAFSAERGGGAVAFDRKFKRFVHYVIWRAGTRDWFGAVKLNKVLWFSDTAFAHTGDPIRGRPTPANSSAPCPRPSCLSAMNYSVRGQ